MFSRELDMNFSNTISPQGKSVTSEIVPTNFISFPSHITFPLQIGIKNY